MKKVLHIGKDRTFKKRIQIAGFTKIKFNGDSNFEYKPDCVLANENTEYFLESSSTGDRKVHIGELIQFLTYISTVTERKENYYFILFLCGKGKYAPRAALEYERLKFYFDHYSMPENIKESIAGIYVVDSEKVSMSLTKDDFSKMYVIYERKEHMGRPNYEAQQQRVNQLLSLGDEAAKRGDKEKVRAYLIEADKLNREIFEKAKAEIIKLLPEIAEDLNTDSK